MLVRLSKWLLVVTLSFMIGAHWAVLQSVAWVGMTVSYAQDSSLSEALSKTFDGHHPCKLCRIVAEGKKSESKQESLKVESKMDLLCGAAPVFILSPPAAASHALASIFIADHADSPPVPPPRTLHV